MVIFEAVVYLLFFLLIGLLVYGWKRTTRIASRLAESEMRLKELFEHMPSGVVVYRTLLGGDDFVVTAFNGAAERIEKMRREDAIGKNVTEIFSGVIEFGLVDVFRSVWQSGVPERFSRSLYKDGRISGWRESYIYKLPGGEIAMIYDDVTSLKQAEEELKLRALLLDNACDTIFVLDLNGNFVYLNETAWKSRGYTREEMMGLNLHTLDTPEYEKLVDTRFRELVEKGASTFESAHYRKDGSIMPVEVNARLIEWGGRTLALSVIRDITERKRAEDALRANEARLQATLDNSPYMIWQKDTDGRYIAFNQPFIKLLGDRQPQDVLGKTDLDLWPEGLAEKYRADDAEVMSSRQSIVIEEQAVKDGQIYWVETCKTPIVDKNGKLLGTTGFAQDITERRIAEERVRHLAHYDALTDLPNRILFGDRLRQALAAARRDKARLALMFIDLDEFKPVNDIYGHNIGDLLLKEAARRMQDCMRESDTIARMGGDEFVVLLPAIEAAQDAMVVAEKIRLAIDRPFELGGENLHVSSSIGIAIFPENGSEDKVLLKNADTAMYFAKASGRNTVKFFPAAEEKEGRQEVRAGQSGASECT